MRGPVFSLVLGLLSVPVVPFASAPTAAHEGGVNQPDALDIARRVGDRLAQAEDQRSAVEESMRHAQLAAVHELHGERGTPIGSGPRYLAARQRECAAQAGLIRITDELDLLHRLLEKIRDQAARTSTP